MKARRESGFTLLEVVVFATLLLPVLGGTFALLSSASDAQARAATAGTLLERASDTAERIAEEIARGGSNTFYPTPKAPWSTDRIEFEVPVRDPATGGTTWELRRIGIVPEPGDPDDGVDNDGDGLVDECLVVLERETVGSPARRTVLATNVRELLEGEVENGLDDNGNGLVDERGLCFVREDGVWSLRLTLERRDRSGATLTRSVETSAGPRNAK